MTFTMLPRLSMIALLLSILFLLAIANPVKESDELRSIDFTDVKTKDVAIRDVEVATGNVTDLIAPTDLTFGYVVEAVATNIPNLAFPLYHLIYDCESFGGDGGHDVACVEAALATLVVLATLSYDLIKPYLQQRAARIVRHGLEIGLGNVIDPPTLIDDVPVALTEFAPDFHIHGYIHRNTTVGAAIIPEGYEWWPVAQFTNPAGHKMHLTYHEKNGETALRIGFAHDLEKRQWGEQYLTGNTMDAKFCEGELKERLSKADFPTMRAIMRCYFPTLSPTAVQVRVALTSTYETIAGISISAVTSNGVTGVYDMPSCPSRDTPLSSCGEGHVHSG